MHTWALDGLGELTELLTSELVTNVVHHVGLPMTLRISGQASTIRVEVTTTAPILRSSRVPTLPPITVVASCS
jgi:hypothetical protein